MSFKLQMNLFTDYSGQGAAAEWSPAKGQILLRRGLPLESSFDTPRCDGKTTTASKGSLP
jgi:hypothetical protein